MSDQTQKRVNAALHSVVNSWMPPAPAEGDLARVRHARRRSTLQELHPDLLRALDELVLAVTADTAAKIEALQKDAAPKLADANRAHLHIAPLGALSGLDPAPCASSRQVVERTTTHPVQFEPGSLLGTAWCPDCRAPAPAERATPRRHWRYATHYLPESEHTT